MKQHITPAQLAQLTPEQREKLREWWVPQPGDMFPCEDGTCIFPITRVEKLQEGYMCYFVRKPERNEFTAVEFSFGSRCGVLPLLSIGQCIELLTSKTVNSVINIESNWYDHPEPLQWYVDVSGWDGQRPELIDALFAAVKAVL